MLCGIIPLTFDTAKIQQIFDLTRHFRNFFQKRFLSENEIVSSLRIVKRAIAALFYNGKTTAGRQIFPFIPCKAKHITIYKDEPQHPTT